MRNDYPTQILWKPSFFLPLLIFVCSAVILVAGFKSEVSLGDEVHHYHFAKECFAVNGRAVTDPLYAAAGSPRFFYETEAAWPLMLSWLWKIGGEVSLPVAQIYHLLFYILLIASTYFLAEEIYDRSAALWSALIVATAPMFVSFSIIFYTDMPAAALCILAVLLMVKRRFVYLGLTMGLAYLTKKSTGFFIPAIFLWMTYEYRKEVKAFLKNNFLCFFSAAAVVFPDFIWRRTYLPKENLIESTVMDRFYSFFQRERFSFKIIDYSNSSSASVKDLVMYVGIPCVVLLGLYFFYKKYQKRDLMLWAFTFIFLFFAGVMRLFPGDIRYVMPIIPLVIIISSNGLAAIQKHHWIKIALVFACSLQLIAASFYTCQRRTIPAGIREGFSFIRLHTPKDALVLYPEGNMWEYTERRVLWSAFDIAVFFWGNEQEKIAQILKIKLDYIAIKKSRIYNDQPPAVRHCGGYPRSFVDFLEKWQFKKMIYENNEMVIYQIDRNALLALEGNQHAA